MQFNINHLQAEAEKQIAVEILDALNSPIYSQFRLGQIAKTYGVSYDHIKTLAERVCEHYLGSDLLSVEYKSVLGQIDQVETEVDPGLREFKIQELARKYRRTPKQLMDVYNKALARQAPVNPLTPEELRRKYAAGVQWLIQGWIPRGAVLLLHADGGVGKSLFTYQIMESVLTGKPWQGYQTTQGGVLLVQVDEPGTILTERLDVRGIGSHPNLGILEDWQIEALAPLEATMKQTKPELLVIDSLTAINRNSIFSENDTEYARPVLQLTALANRTQTTIIIIHHSNASGNARGTRAIHNSVSEVWAMSVGQQPDDRLLRVQKMRLGRPPGRYNFKFHEDDLSFSYQGEEGETYDTTVTQEKKIQLWLSEPDRIGKSYAAWDIAEQMNISQSRIRILLYELWSKGLINREVTTTPKGQRAYLYFAGQKGDRLYGGDHLSITFDDHLSNPDAERVSEDSKKGDQGDRQFFKKNEPQIFFEKPTITDHLSTQSLAQHEKKGDREKVIVPPEEAITFSESDHLSFQKGDLIEVWTGEFWMKGVYLRPDPNFMISKLKDGLHPGHWVKGRRKNSEERRVAFPDLKFVERARQRGKDALEP